MPNPFKIEKPFRTRVLVAFLGSLVPLFILLAVSVESLLVPSVKDSALAELTNTTILLRNSVQASATASIRNHLKTIADKNREIAQHHLQMVNKGSLSQKDAKQRLREIFVSQQVGTSGYIYCLDSQGIAVVHPVEGVEGTDNTQFTFIHDQIRMKEGYIEYDWRNPGEVVERPKALYMSYFEPFDWIISVSSYRSEFIELLNPSDFREAVLSLRFGERGYAYVFAPDGQVFIHPSLQGINIFEQDELPTEFVREMVAKGSGSIEYKWQNPDEAKPTKKIAVFETVDELGWIVVSSAYLNEVYRPVTVARYVAYGFILLILFASIFIAFAISKKLTQPVEAIVTQLDKNAQSGRQESLPIFRSDELGRLANEINSYLAVVEEQNKRIAIEQARYRSLFETSPDAIYLLDNLTIVDCNPKTCELFGGTPEQLIGKSIVDFSPPLQANGQTSQELASKIIDGLGEKNLDIFEWKHVTLSGLPFDAEVRLKVFDNESQDSFLVAFTRDITQQKKAEDSLRHSHYLMQYIIEYDPSAIALLDKDLNFIYVSNRFIKDYRIDEKEVIGRHHYEVFPEIPEKWREVHRRALQGEVIGSDEDFFIRPDGTKDWTRWECRPWYKNNEVGGIILYTEVINERKEAEKALQQSEERFKLLFEQAPVGYQSLDGNGCFLDVNETWQSMLGYNKEELIGKCFCDILAPEFREDFRHQFTIFKTQGKIQSEYTMHRKDGSQIVIALSGRLGYTPKGDFKQAHFTLNDITERKQWEERLFKQSSFIETLLRAIPVPVFYKDKNGKYLGCNKAFTEVMGVTHEEIAGKTVHELWPGELAQKYHLKDIELVNNPQHQIYEFNVKNKDGEIRDVIFAKDVFYDEKGEPAGLVGAFMDITEQKRISEQLEKYKNHLEMLVKERTEELEAANEELTAANEELLDQRAILQSTLDQLKNTQRQLLQSEKMASLGVLATGVSHEINNPLNFINGGIASIEKYLEKKLEDHIEPLSPMINAVNEGVRRATQIVKSLNHYSRNVDLPSLELDLHSVIENCLVMLSKEFDGRIDLVKKFSSDPYVFIGNEGKIHQAILNIVQNAAQAIENHGTITISTKVIKNNMLISFADSGCGIEQENISKVNDPFYTTKDPGKGIGLGLSITQNIIEEHHGSLEINSKINVGTTVLVKLPLKK